MFKDDKIEERSFSSSFFSTSDVSLPAPFCIPLELTTTVPPPRPPKHQEISPLTSPTFGNVQRANRHVPLSLVHSNTEPAKLSLYLPMSMPRNSKKKTKRREIYYASSSDDELSDDAVDTEVYPQPAVQKGEFEVQVKPSRRKNTSFAPHGMFPKQMCSQPYKYILRVTHPVHDNLTEEDIRVYLTAFDSDGRIKGELDAGVEVEYLRTKVKDDWQTHFFHMQFTLTSFLNHSEMYKINVEAGENRRILVSSEIKLVARKDKGYDDRFWNQFLIELQGYERVGKRKFDGEKKKRKRRKRK